MRLTARHGEAGLELFVYGVSGGAFPARQHLQASKAIARLHGLDPERTLFVEQSEEAIAAGAFHNDVVAVANENVLFAHELAFADRNAVLAFCEKRLPGFELVEVPSADVPIGDAIASYLFNAQLVSPPDGEMTLVVPTEARETPTVWAWLEKHVSGNGPIRRVEVVDVRQSMANGGGPACLRLRVVADPETVDPRFMVDDAKLDRLSEVVRRNWPVEIDTVDLQKPALVKDVEAARKALLEELDLTQLA
jgi:succinylarginine dihydrolase